MPGLKTITDKIRVVTSSAAGIDVVTEYSDLENFATGTQRAVPGTQNTKISTAATTTIVDQPGAATTFRRLEEATLRNIHATLSCDVTVYLEMTGPVNYEIVKITLKAGETLQYKDGVGWYLLAALRPPQLVTSVADQVLSAAATTYIDGTGLTINAADWKIGTRIRLSAALTKTAAGTAASSFIVKFGTVGTVADTDRITLTLGVGTAAVDTAFVEVVVVIRGPITAACIASGRMFMTHNLSATTGFAAVPTPTIQVASAAFDITTVTKVGLAIATGASQAWTVQQASAQIEMP